MEFDNTNRGVLFANYQRGDDGPEYSGKINVEGNEQNLFGKVESEVKVSVYTADGLIKGHMEKTDKEGKSEKYPDWKGKAEGNDSSYNLAGWKRISKKGAAFLSISIEASSPAPVQQPVQEAASDDSLPF